MDELNKQDPVNTWCCEPTTYGQHCECPAEFFVIYGNSPTDVTLMCKGHVMETWQPTWEVRELTDEERISYGVPRSQWVSEHKECLVTGLFEDH